MRAMGPPCAPRSICLDGRSSRRSPPPPPRTFERSCRETSGASVRKPGRVVLPPAPPREAGECCCVKVGAVTGGATGAEAREFERPTDEFLGAGELFGADWAERGDEAAGEAWRAGLALPPREKLGMERGAACAGLDWETWGACETRGAEGREAGIEPARLPEPRPTAPPPPPPPPRAPPAGRPAWRPLPPDATARPAT